VGTVLVDDVAAIHNSCDFTFDYFWPRLVVDFVLGLDLELIAVPLHLLLWLTVLLGQLTEQTVVQDDGCHQVLVNSVNFI